jgi:hypothetical protein
MSLYYVPQKTFNFELLVVIPLDKLKLESQASLFKTVMFHNGFEILKKDGKTCNHLKCMQLFISNSKMLTLGIFVYVKFAKLAMCQVLGSIDDEHCFSILFFMKGKLCNHLTTHLDVCDNVFTRLLQH